MDDAVISAIRTVLEGQGRLSSDVGSVPLEASLYEAGMTSHASVNVMLGLEDAFDIEFPDRMLTRNVFESIGSIAAAVSELQEEEAA